MPAMLERLRITRNPWLERGSISLLALVLIAVAIRDPWGIAAEALPAVFLAIALLVARCGHA